MITDCQTSHVLGGEVDRDHKTILKEFDCPGKKHDCCIYTENWHQCVLDTGRTKDKKHINEHFKLF